MDACSHGCVCVLRLRLAWQTAAAMAPGAMARWREAAGAHVALPFLRGPHEPWRGRKAGRAHVAFAPPGRGLAGAATSRTMLLTPCLPLAHSPQVTFQMPLYALQVGRGTGGTGAGGGSGTGEGPGPGPGAGDDWVSEVQVGLTY